MASFKRALFVCVVLWGLSDSFVVRGAENILHNLSARGRVDSGENVLIGGLAVEHRSNFLIRGMGPSLSLFNIENPLAHARLTLFDGKGKPIAGNDDWRLGVPTGIPASESPFAAYDLSALPNTLLDRISSGAGAFKPASNHDAMLYVELPEGLYTCALAAADGSAGVGLVEIYAVPDSVDPFPPANRVRSTPLDGYSPTLDGLAPVSAVPDMGGVTLVLEFAQAKSWSSNGVVYGPFTHIEIPFEATGTRDLQRGKPGVFDSRNWRIAPLYAKTDLSKATVTLIGTPDSSSHSISESFILDFDSLGGGTFTETWSQDDATVASGSGAGRFHWTRSNVLVATPGPEPARFFKVYPHAYKDGRPDAVWAVETSDAGIVLHHGDGPNGCDVNGMREASIAYSNGHYVLHYDGCAVGGWRACRAVSDDLATWRKDGPILDLGASGSVDAGAAASPWVFEQNGTWYMYYLATPDQNGAPDFIPFFPYRTRLATADSLLGPWTKQTGVVPFDLLPGGYYATGASPGVVIEHNGEYLQYFSAGPYSPQNLPVRTLGLARTHNLGGAWTPDASSLLPEGEQVENTSIYYEPTDGKWYLFTNHVGISGAGTEFTDAIWMYWSSDPTHFDAEHKAVVLDGSRCAWSKGVIGMPSVIKVGNSLNIFYDGYDGFDTWHMKRDIGMARISLPLVAPF